MQILILTLSCSSLYPAIPYMDIGISSTEGNIYIYIYIYTFKFAVYIHTLIAVIRQHSL